MTKPKDLTQSKLPITAELGDEGGSYGDATVQAETMKGTTGNERIDPKREGPPGGPHVAAASQGEQVRPADDQVKHATEPPDA